MAISNIEALCAGLCELLGVPSPQLVPNAKGTLAATIRLRGVNVAMQQFANRHADCVFLRVDMGEVYEQHELAAWRVLMQANLRLVGEWAPRFSRHPATGHATLHWPCPLMPLNVPEFHRRVQALVDACCKWREDQFLENADEAHAWFDPSDASGVLTAASLGRPEPDAELADIASLMELNHFLASRHCAMRVGREPGEGTHLLVFATSTMPASQDELLAIGRELDGVASQWRQQARESREQLVSETVQ
jgi:hypothetical protein